jgi:hypothetical protein
VAHGPPVAVYRRIAQLLNQLDVNDRTGLKVCLAFVDVVDEVMMTYVVQMMTMVMMTVVSRLCRSHAQDLVRDR